MNTLPANILVIKLGALGDLIMATSLIKRIAERHFTEKVHVLTSPGYVRVLQGWESLHVEALSGKGVFSMLKTVYRIRSRHFRRIYDLQSNDRSAILCALSGVREIAGNHPGFPYRYHPAERYTGQCHVKERLDQVLASAGIESGDETPYLPAGEKSIEKVGAWLAEKGLADRSFVLMHAGASARHPEKRWPYFLDLARELKALSLATVWLGGTDDIVLNKELVSVTGIDTTGLFSVAEEAELGRHAKFAVTNDSAPMHILSCSGLPVFGLFGPSDWRRSHAIGQKQYVISAGNTGPDGGFVPADISGISVNRVLERLRVAGLI